MKKQILLLPLITFGLFMSFSYFQTTGTHLTANHGTIYSKTISIPELGAIQVEAAEEESTLDMPITRGSARNYFTQNESTHVLSNQNVKYMSHLLQRSKDGDERFEAHVTKKQKRNTITIRGHRIPWVADHQAKAAPTNAAGVWFGTGSTTDKKTSHFIGHNPGLFHPVMSLHKGNPITVVDGKGHKRTYHVTKVINMYDWGADVRTNKNEDYDILETPGERITLQTCITDSINRIVFAS
ncbi:sortase domain-bontaining protein [Periweissella cryptocerci]|nr:sortase [Periweissella cryptocerci]